MCLTFHEILALGLNDSQLPIVIANFVNVVIIACLIDIHPTHLRTHATLFLHVVIM